MVGLLCALGWLRILARIAKGFDSERPKWRDELIVIAWYLGALIWAFLGAGFVIWGVTILARLLTTA